MEQHEYIIKLQMIQQEAGQLEEKVRVIEDNIQDMIAIKASIVDLEGKKEGDEILTNLGKGIFMKTKMESKDLFINVGKNIMVKKNLKQAGKILDDQVKKLEQGKSIAMARIEELQGEMQGLIAEAEKDRAKEDKKK
jgi:prefoldin alpha subunit